ncbi:MAG: hypothetical protein PHR28_08090 [candidate division Zixibacteria bacterium]|nr:hypothetical protein [candidate division Zixibacteria bacterium]
MRQSLKYLVLLTVFAFGAAYAQESSSGSGRLHGQNDLAPLDSVISPLWQTAWPARSWDALYEAGPRLLNVLPSLIDLGYSSHNGKKYDRYKKHTTTLEKYIIQYGAAAGNRDSGLIAELLPRIKAELDTTTAMIRPTPYPAFEKLHSRVEHFVASQWDASDDSCLTAETDTLLVQAVDLEQSVIPAEISDKTTMIREEFAYYRVLAQRIKDALIKRDHPLFRRQARLLQTRLNNFVRLYLQ